MSQYSSFVHFARDLFLCSTNRELQISDKKLKPIPFMIHPDGLLDYFNDGHALFFDKNFDKEYYNYQEFRNDEQLFRFLIPRCLKLIDNEKYFYSMIMVASFLQEFLRFMKETRYCYRFCFTSYKCFLAVFKRAFEDDFEDHGGLEGFRKFSEEALGSVTGTIEKYVDLPFSFCFYNYDPCLIKRMTELIEKCDDIPDESFVLNDYELSLLKDDDVDEVLQSIESDITEEDPLGLQWPPSQEEVQEKLKAVREAYDRKYNSIDNSGSEESDSEDSGSKYSDEEITFPDLFSYISHLEKEATDRLGYAEFKEKKKFRKCPSCGIKCFQFSLTLHSKQLDSALVGDSDAESF